MIAGVAGNDAARAAARLRGPEPAQSSVEPGLAVAWEGGDVSVARAGGVLCVAAGTAYATTLATAWLAGGAEEVAGVSGTFAALVWDVAARRGALVADPLGTRTFVYRRAAGSVSFALEPRDLLRLLDATPAPDPAAVTAWLAGGELAPDATLYAGVERLAGGHALELGAAAAPLRYWAPRYVPPERIGREEAEVLVREEVQRATARAVDGTARPGVLLSGGLDSATVAAASRRAGRPPHAYSLVFPTEPDVDESELIAHVSGELGLPSTRVEHDGAAGLLDATRAYVETWAVPPASPTLAVHAPLLARAAADGVDVLLDGQGGDELFGSSLELLADLVRSGRLRAARELAHRIDGIPEHLHGRAARRALLRFGFAGALPAAVRRTLRQARRRPRTAPWLRLDASPAPEPAGDGPEWWRTLADAVTAQRERAGAHDHLRRRNASAGVVGAHPLLQDRGLLELVLRLPPELAFDAAHDRPLLRGAMRGLVPRRILERSEKAFFTPVLVRAVAQTDNAEIRSLLLAPDAEIQAYAEPEQIRRLLLEAPVERRGGSWAWALWRLAAVETWLRAQPSA